MDCPYSTLAAGQRTDFCLRHLTYRGFSMDWTPGGMSSDIEDRRSSSGGFGGMGGGGIGIVGFVILLIITLLPGRNYLGSVLSGGGSTSVREPARRPAANETRDVQLVSFVLD